MTQDQKFEFALIRATEYLENVSKYLLYVNSYVIGTEARKALNDARLYLKFAQDDLVKAGNEAAHSTEEKTE